MDLGGFGKGATRRVGLVLSNAKGLSALVGFEADGDFGSETDIVVERQWVGETGDLVGYRVL